jgi:hypothetical protein
MLRRGAAGHQSAAGFILQRRKLTKTWNLQLIYLPVVLVEGYSQLMMEVFVP